MQRQGRISEDTINNAQGMLTMQERCDREARYGWRGWRVGEAAQPGPRAIVVGPLATMGTHFVGVPPGMGSTSFQKVSTGCQKLIKHHEKQIEYT